MAPAPGALRAVLLDLDGTLLDTAPDIAEAANRLLVDLGREALPESRIRDFIGRGIANLVRRVLEVTGPEPAPAQMADALSRFEAYYFERVADRSQPYPGVLEGLAAFRAAGLGLACVTNKEGRFALPLLEATGLAPLLDVVVSGNDVARKKPAPDAFLLAASRLGCEPAQAWVIGDSANDVEAARAAGCPVAVVPYGYREGLEVGALGADEVVASLEAAARSITMARQL